MAGQGKVQCRPVKIGLLGCAGLGKSTIAGEVSSRLSLPVLNSKDITRPILARNGYCYGNGFVEVFLSRSDIEREIVCKRLEEEELLSCGFVTDRTTLECFCYAFLGLDTYGEGEFELLERACKGNMKKYTHLYLLPFGKGWFVENGVRTVNLHFQRHMDMVIRGVVEDWGIPARKIPADRETASSIADFIVSDVNRDRLQQEFDFH